MRWVAFATGIVVGYMTFALAVLYQWYRGHRFAEALRNEGIVLS